MDRAEGHRSGQEQFWSVLGHPSHGWQSSISKTQIWPCHYPCLKAFTDSLRSTGQFLNSQVEHRRLFVIWSFSAASPLAISLRYRCSKLQDVLFNTALLYNVPSSRNIRSGSPSKTPFSGLTSTFLLRMNSSLTSLGSFLSLTPTPT